MALRYVWQKWNVDKRDTYNLGRVYPAVRGPGEPRQTYKSYSFDRYTGTLTFEDPYFFWGDDDAGKTAYGESDKSYYEGAFSVCSKWGWSYDPGESGYLSVQQGDPEYTKGSTSRMRQEV